MGEKLIFAERTIEGFTYESGVGFYMIGTTAPFALELGKTYRVVWDGEEFVCKSYTGDYLQVGMMCHYLGNEMFLTGQSTEIIEPFVISYTPESNWIALVATDANSSHTVALYELTESEDEDEGIGIILKDRDGNDEVYTGVEAVKMSTSDGGTVTFIKGEKVTKAVDLDFSEGDMLVTPESGKLFEEVTIQKPENLVPENVKKDVEVAGVIGLLETGAGGGGMDVLISGLVEDVTTVVTTIRPYAFYYSNTIKKIDALVCNTLGKYAFYYCDELTTVNMPLVTDIPDYAFYYNLKLANVHLGQVTKIGAYAFSNCPITEFNAGRVQSVGSGAFNNTNIKKLDFGTSLNSVIGSSAFNTKGACDIIIRNTEMIPDASSQYSYIFGRTDQRLFVPKTLVSTWKASNYMKAYHSKQVYAIEDYPDICG